jgi:hypothetical protein
MCTRQPKQFFPSTFQWLIAGTVKKWSAISTTKGQVNEAVLAMMNKVTKSVTSACGTTLIYS